MIARISGIVGEVTEEAVLIERDGLGYEVLIPGYAVAELAACRGREVTLYTLQYYEGSAVGSHLVPRIVGFLRRKDRRFFERFVTVKGIGIRKGLKALTEPVTAVATAIENGDVQALARLPGIGRRGASQIVAELRGKVAEFAAEHAASQAGAQASLTESQQQAVAILCQLGERRADAERWIARAARLRPDITTPDGWIRAAYRIKEGAEP